MVLVLSYSSSISIHLVQSVHISLSALHLISTCPSVPNRGPSWTTLLLTSCSAGTAALAWRPSLKPKPTLSWTHRNFSLYVLALFSMFSVWESMHMCVRTSVYLCVSDRLLQLRHPLFLHLLTTPVVKDDSGLNESLSFLLSLTLTQQNRSTSPLRPTEYLLIGKSHQ